MSCQLLQSQKMMKNNIKFGFVNIKLSVTLRRIISKMFREYSLLRFPMVNMSSHLNHANGIQTVRQSLSISILTASYQMNEACPIVHSESLCTAC